MWRRDPLGFKYQYDEHGRLDRITDLRNGTTQLEYNVADLVSTVTAPPSEVDALPQVSTTLYDNHLRPSTEIAPDQSAVNTLYTPNGLPKHRSGARVYPVDYSYDAQGRSCKDPFGSLCLTRDKACQRTNFPGCSNST
jgi:YD repeat-containing protein